jgi:hypothetical protein
MITLNARRHSAQATAPDALTPEQLEACHTAGQEEGLAAISEEEASDAWWEQEALKESETAEREMAEHETENPF